MDRRSKIPLKIEALWNTMPGRFIKLPTSGRTWCLSSFLERTYPKDGGKNFV